MTAESSFDSAQRFILAAKGYWTTSLYGNLREQYFARCSEQGVEPATVPQVAAVAEGLTVYQYFAWLERHLQIAKYSGRYGLAHYYREHADEALQDLNAASGELPNLTLDPELRMPSYYVATDIHQHPGGVWSEPTAGLVYQHGARSTTPLLGESHGDLHTRFTDKILAGGTPARVLDLACGFGKSTLPFASKLPKASVTGIDLAEPCLRLAARTSAQAGLTNVRFAQRDASTPGFADASFDLVTSTMFLHEIPLKVLDKVLDESFRLLAPGGRMVHLDFWHIPDPFSRFMHYGHGRRNNEPYMQPLAELDLPKALAEKGFVDVSIEPFSETVDADLSSVKAWRFPWTYISARKPG